MTTLPALPTGATTPSAPSGWINPGKDIDTHKILPPRCAQRPVRAIPPEPTTAPAPERTDHRKALTMPQKSQYTAARDRYLSVAEVAEILGTTERFPRRLIEERRIEYKRFGRHVRIAASVLNAYIESCTVAPARRRQAA